MPRVRQARSEAAQQQLGDVSLASSDSGGRNRGNGNGERPEPKRDERTQKVSPTRVYIAVNGCHENHMDAALVQRYLGSTGRFVAAANVGDADVVIVQGCAVTQHMENESRDIIAHLEQVKRPDAKLIVAGCIARFRPELATGDAGTSVPLDEIGHIMYDLDENARRLAVNHLESAPEDLQAYLGERKEQVFAGYTAEGESASLPGASSRRSTSRSRWSAPTRTSLSRAWMCAVAGPSRSRRARAASVSAPTARCDRRGVPCAAKPWTRS